MADHIAHPYFFADLLRRIRERIRPVVSHMDDVEFEAVTERMARVEYEFLMRDRDDAGADSDSLSGIRTPRESEPL